MEARDFIKKETLAQLFSYEFCKILKNTYFEKYLRTATSTKLRKGRKHDSQKRLIASFTYI